MTVRLATVRGIALPITLLVASIVVVLATWMLIQGTQSLALVGNENQGQASLYAAEAGLAFARAQLAATPSWGQPSPPPSTAGAVGAVGTSCRRQPPIFRIPTAGVPRRRTSATR